jgi:hypothetical protein
VNPTDSAENSTAPRAERCSCDQPPRRLCDVCESQGQSFLACSLACLDRHLAEEHTGASAGGSVARARAYASELNRRFPDSWLGYASHRERVTGHIEQIAQAGELCVFGAGNCNDLELEQLAHHFSELHLVDLDGEALARSRARQGSLAQAKIVLHPDVDCSGMLEHLDDWGERFPERGELGRSAVAAAQGIVRGLGRSFPVVVSACVMSQLAVPFQRAWITSRANWGDLLSTISAVHLATLTGSTSPGGCGLIVFDTSSSKDTPALSDLRARSSEELEEFVTEARESGGLFLRPDPRDLVKQLLSPGLRSLVADPELSAPWLWHLGSDTQLVYSLTFRHPSS